MGRVLLAGGAELLKIELALHLLLVLTGIIIDASAGGAFHPGEIFREFGLSHAKLNLAIFGKFCKRRTERTGFD